MMLSLATCRSRPPRGARRSRRQPGERQHRARRREPLRGLRQADAAGAADLWQALVSGSWSIVETVETVERDGKRLLLARANPLGSPELTSLTRELTSLTRDESDIVWLAAFGHTYKLVAYEPGFTVSNLVRRFQSAMLKLGVASRRDLLRKLGRQAFYTVRFSAIDPP